MIYIYTLGTSELGLSFSLKSNLFFISRNLVKDVFFGLALQVSRIEQKLQVSSNTIWVLVDLRSDLNISIYQIFDFLPENILAM